MTLDARAWLALAIVGGVMCALLFGTAGTTQYWQAWIDISIFLGASVLTTLYLMKKDRALLARRMRGGPMFEKEGTQRIIMVFTSLGFIALLVVPALDHRFVWSAVPVWGVVLGEALVAIGVPLSFSSSIARTASRRRPLKWQLPEGHRDRTVRRRAPSDVRERSALHARHAARARLVLGLPRARRDDAVPALAAPRRGENSNEGLPGYAEYRQHVPSSPRTDGVVARIDMSQERVVIRRAEVAELWKVETVARRRGGSPTPASFPDEVQWRLLDSWYHRKAGVARSRPRDRASSSPNRVSEVIGFAQFVRRWRSRWSSRESTFSGQRAESMGWLPTQG